MFKSFPKKSLSVLGLTVCLGAMQGLGSPFHAGDAMQDALKARDSARQQQFELESLTTRPIMDAIWPMGASLPADKDDDGMADSWEKANGFKPTDPNDAWLDADKDGIVNLFEYQLGSDPKNAATPPVVTVGSGGDYADLKSALDGAAPGSCLRVAGGTHKVNYMTFNLKVVMIQGGWDPTFKVRNLKTTPTILDGQNKDEVLYFSFSSGNPVVILDGLKIINGKDSFGAVNLLAQTTAFLKTSLFNCQIVKSSNTSYYGAVLHTNSWDKSLADRTIANTVIGSNSASGIYAQITGSAAARWRIIHSAIAKNASTASDSGYGIKVSTSGTGNLKTHIFNSIVWGNSKEDVKLTFGNLTFNVNNSDVGKVLAQYGAVYKKGAGNLNKDPKFVSVAKADFHLKPTSPVINKGLKKGMPAVDFEGDKRVKGAAPDMGPDEVK